MELVSLFLFLLLISSGSIFCASYFNKKYETVLPITCGGIIILSFLFGVLGLLEYSTIVLIVISLLLYIFSIIKIVKEKSFKQFIKNILTPGFVAFVILLGIMFVGTYGKLLDCSDEFSHWGDVVKSMCFIDDFGTNPNANTLFPSYPPAMSLFQYILEKINFYLCGEVFSEWLVYFGYDILCLAFLMPVCERFTYKRTFSIFTFIVGCICVPFVFYLYSYFSLYIDAFLSFLIGAGAIKLMWHDKCDIWFDLSMISIIFVLVLAKDAGLAFGVFLAIGMIIEHLLDNNKSLLSKNNIIAVLEAIIAVVLPKLLWSINIKLQHANKVFSAPMDFGNLILVLIGKDQSYRRKVLKNFVAEMVTGGIQLGNTNIYINYFAFLVISIVAIYIVCKLAKDKNLCSKIYCLTAKYSLIISVIVFIIGTCIAYMYKFSEVEALGLASFNRYISIVYLAMWFFISFSIIMLANESDSNNKLICSLLICVMVLSTSLEAIVTFGTNAYAKASIALRERYTEFVDIVKDKCEPGSKVWLIDEYNSNEDWLALRFLLRPVNVNGDWSLGTPYDEDDSHTVQISASEWKKQLLDGDYDYVAFYNINWIFRKDFAECFEDVSVSDDYTVFKVNKKTGILSICD